MAPTPPTPTKQRLLELTNQISTTISQALPSDDTDTSTLDRRNLRALVRELQLAFYDPNEAIFIQTHYLARTSAIRALLELGVIPALVSKRIMTASELAKEVHFDNPELISRLLRFLVAENIVYTADGTTFVSTPYLDAYLSPAGDRWANRYNEFVPAATALAEYLSSHDAKDIADPRHTVHSWANGQEGEKLFDIVASTPERAALWNRAMMAEEGNSALGMFPWEVLLEGDEEGRVLVVDVGGGYGHHARAILTAHPDFYNRIVVQDQRHVIASSAAKANHAGIKLMSHNFHTPQPIQGAKSYFFSRVLHNFYDDRACAVLKNTVRAMAPDSRILIADQLVPEVPSFGALDDVLVLDFFMLLMGGKERTEKDFRALAQRAGLRVERIWTASKSYQCIVELRLLR